VPRSLGHTRLTLVEDHRLFAEALDVALTLEGHDVSRVAIDDATQPGGNLVAAILRTRPCVVLLDLDLGPFTSGLNAVEPLTRVGVAVVVLTADPAPARWGECLRYGARTVLSKTAPLNTILATIRTIGEKRPVLSREDRERLLLTYHEELAWLHENRRRLESLTRREREILAELVLGRQVREIARTAVVSETTVRTQVKSILTKLGVTSQLAAVGVAVKAQWQEPRSA
jgi:two-component system nitrate/nitrite response regulator NarL